MRVISHGTLREAHGTCVGSVKLMPRKEGKAFVSSFVNYMDGTLLGKCRDMLKVLDDTAPSWNSGVKISISEREDGKRAKPIKEMETDAEREERLEKLGSMFPWTPREDVQAVVARWTQREGKGAQKLSNSQQMQLLGFGGEALAHSDARDSDSSDDAAAGSKRRRRAKQEQEQESTLDGDDSDGKLDAKRSKLLPDKLLAHQGQVAGAQERGGAGISSIDSGMDAEGMDAEERVALESVDDWRIGRHLISRMGYCAAHGLGLGLPKPSSLNPNPPPYTRKSESCVLLCRGWHADGARGGVSRLSPVCACRLWVPWAQGTRKAHVPARTD
jgi:hypothetical protein